MNFNEFTTRIKNTFSEMYPDSNVILQEVIKNNDSLLQGLVIQGESNICPTIYLNGFYEQYQCGEAIGKIVQTIKELYEDNRITQNLDVSYFADFDAIKDRIIFKVVNFEKNQRLLMKVPYVRFMDLALVFQVLLENNLPDGMATILINNRYMNLWGKAENELYDMALKNTQELLPHEIKEMTSLLSDLLDTDYCLMKDRMWVLSNKEQVNGASVILYKNLLCDMVDKFGTDIIIIPSSVHEVILMPLIDEMDFESLNLIVQDVNKMLNPEDVLSNHVYCFSHEEKSFY